MSVELVVTDPSTAQYDKTFGRALEDFEKLMGQDRKPTDFQSAKAVLEVLSRTVQRFRVDDFRASNQRLTTWLESYVNLLFTVSETLWETTQDVSVIPCHVAVL